MCIKHSKAAGRLAAWGERSQEIMWQNVSSNQTFQSETLKSVRLNESTTESGREGVKYSEYVLCLRVWTVHTVWTQQRWCLRFPIETLNVNSDTLKDFSVSRLETSESRDVSAFKSHNFTLWFQESQRKGRRTDRESCPENKWKPPEKGILINGGSTEVLSTLLE